MSTITLPVTPAPSQEKNALVIRFKNKIYYNVPKIPDILKQPYYPGLDGLRAISIIMVIGFHIFTELPEQSQFLNSIFNGELGVNVFFNISGFIITTILLKEKVIKGTINLKNFYLRRSFRIFPLAYLFIVVLIGLNFILDLDISFLAFLTAGLYLKNLFNTGGPTGHYWSLSVEEQFYLLFPFILKKSLSVFFFVSAFLVIWGIPIFNVIGFHVPAISSLPAFKLLFSLVRSLDCILIGSLFAIIFFRYHNLFVRYSNSFVSFSILSLIILINSDYEIFSGIQTFIYSKLISSILISTFICLNLFPKKGIMYGFLNNGLVSGIGKLSYSLYVWQQIFTSHIPWKGLFPHSDSIVLNLVALFVVAFLSYNYFEKPLLKYKAKFQ